MEESEKKCQSTQSKLEELVALKKKLSNVEKSNKALEASKEVHVLIEYVHTCTMTSIVLRNCVLQKVIGELEETKNATGQLKENKKKLELDLRNTKKQFEAQELVSTCTCPTLRECASFIIV